MNSKKFVKSLGPLNTVIMSYGKNAHDKSVLSQGIMKGGWGPCVILQRIDIQYMCYHKEYWKDCKVTGSFLLEIYSNFFPRVNFEYLNTHHFSPFLPYGTS